MSGGCLGLGLGIVFLVSFGGWGFLLAFFFCLVGLVVWGFWDLFFLFGWLGFFFVGFVVGFGGGFLIFLYLYLCI